MPQNQNRSGAQFGQNRPGSTAAVSIFSPDYRDLYTIENIIVCNTTAGAVTYSIFHDENGTTYDQTTAIVYGASIDANTTVVHEYNLYMRDPAGNLAVQISSANAVTFTVNGTSGSV